MRVLFDNGVPRGLAAALRQHSVDEARAHGWDALRNGDLLTAAEAAGFAVFVTTDRNLKYQQNLASRRIGIVVLSRASWPLIKRHLPLVTAAIDTIAPGGFVEVEVSPT
jgi:hypothetical protein